MGILNTDIGFALGQLAGGLWAKNYVERGEAKKAHTLPNETFNQTIQNWHDLGTRIGINRNNPYQTNPFGTQPNPFGTPTNYLDLLNNQNR